jgi:archaellin
MKKNTILVLSLFCLVLLIVLAGCQTGAAKSSPSTNVSSTTGGTPAKLAFLSQPGGAAAGAGLSTQPVVAIQDASGNTVTSAIAAVKLTINSKSGGISLFGPSAINAVNGLAQYANLFVDKAGADYTLVATSGDLTPAASSPFTISPGPADKLAFTVQPSNGTAGVPLSRQPEVIVQDHYGNTVTSYNGSITLALLIGTGPSSAEVLGSSTIPVVNNAAKFTNISISRSNPMGFKITAMSDSLQNADSDPFTVVAGEAAKLEFTVQPSGAKAGKPFETQPKVAIEDRFGNVSVVSKTAITLAVTPNTGAAGAILAGTKTLAAEGGMGGGLAEFADLSIDKAGSGYTLTATSGSLPSIASQAFAVAP